MFHFRGEWVDGLAGSATGRQLRSEQSFSLTRGSSLDGSGFVNLQAVGRSYVAPDSDGFSGEKQDVKLLSAVWAKKMDMGALTAQLAWKGSASKWENSDGTEVKAATRIFLAQMGVERPLSESASIELFGRGMTDGNGGNRGGYALEWLLDITEDLAWSVGYSTLGVDDPDLQPVVVWPEGAYFRVRAKF